MKQKIIPLLLILLLGMSACDSSEKSKYSVMQGEFISSFTETGELAAINAVGLMVPQVNYRYGYEFKIMQMLDNGTQVQAGDTVIKLDDASIRKAIITLEEELEKERAASKKMKVECTNAIQDLEAQLKSEQARYNLKKLELERAKYEPSQKQKITQLEFEQATIRIERLRKKLRIKPILNEYDLSVQRTKILQKEANLSGAIHALGLMNIITPASGLFQSGRGYMFSAKELKVGDPAHSGMPIAKIPDISRMKVYTWVNEADIAKVKLGNEVIVRMDALHSVPFHGQVSSVNRISIKKDNEQVFKVEIKIDETDSRLKPGMTVACEFISYKGLNDLYVPNNCVFQEDGQEYVLIGQGSKQKRIDVLVGGSNSHHTHIIGKLKPGQALVSLEKILTPE